MNSFEKLKTKLAELFQLDQADLDFGIYRIMNARRDEITRFLERDLLPQVREAFAEYKSSDKAEIQKELDKVVEGVKAAGMDPEQAPKVKELRARLAGEAVDIAALENDVYDHLYSFFSRYYDEGDFISLRRYKEGVYAIPYEGEEVKLHWANHDQYYIKTTEYFRDYTFKTPTGHRVHFKIVEADTEKDNIKAANGNDRRFFLHGDKPVAEEDGELVIRFEYRPDGEKRRQDAINAETARRVIEDLNDEKLAVWQHRLSAKWTRADGTASDRTILEKHLFDYTRRNTFDYFIHKELGGFLRRELDFYIKNEVMRLDDIEEESAPRVEQYLSKIKVIRRIAHKIIDFLAQIENFQKKLWLKKKFVVETQYCITVGNIEESFYADIAACEPQWAEWKGLFHVDDEETNLFNSDKDKKGKRVAFLKGHPTLVLDTKHFDRDFVDRLLSSVDDLDGKTDGLLINSENFQALNVLLEKYRGELACIYIDPPFNSPSTEILYKNDYKHSSWITLLENRITLTRPLLTDGVYIIAIDENEQERLGLLIQGSWLGTFKSVCVSVRHNPRGIQGTNFSHCHEYAYFLYPSDAKKYIGERKLEEPDVRNLRDSGLESDRTDARNCFYPFVLREGQIQAIGDVAADDYHPKGVNESKPDGTVYVWPIDTRNNEKKWRYARQSVERILPKLEARETRGKFEIYYAKDTGTVRTIWSEAQFDASEYGTKLLQDLFGTRDLDFSYPKSLYTLIETIRVSCRAEKPEWVLDFFAGSGTTGHAVINLNREDGGRRKFILVEMGQYFDTVTLRRIKKVTFIPEWKDGKPKRMVTQEEAGRSPRIVKYIRLESYEDALANIRLSRTEAQRTLLEAAEGFRESYMLKYMLNVESKGSQTLLNIDNFDDPWNYQLLVGTGSVGETKPVNVDLVETFNWLLGLKVKHIDRISGFQVVEGTSPKGEKVLVIWRKVRDLAETDPEKIAAAREKANRDLEAFFRKQQYNTLDSEFDVLYVNGDNNLMNVPLDPEKEGVEPRYKVRLIEEEFKRLMFDVKDV